MLGLMCKYSCEDCDLVVYGSASHRQVELEKGTILDNMESVLHLQSVGINLVLSWVCVCNDITVHCMKVPSYKLLYFSLERSF